MTDTPSGDDTAALIERANEWQAFYRQGSWGLNRLASDLITDLVAALSAPPSEAPEPPT